MSQIETLLVLALGSALTFVVVLLFGRFFWGLSVSAAAKRKVLLMPVEVLDAQAERDKLRAEHALMARKLDLRLEDIKVRMAEQMAEVSRNRNRVQGLIEDIERKDEIIRRKEQDNANLAAQIELSNAELNAAHKSIESLNADAQRSETEMSRLQNAFRKISVSMRDKQQAWSELSGDLRSATFAAPLPQEMPAHTEQVLRRRVAEITAISADMKRLPNTPEVSQAAMTPDTNLPQHTEALTAKINEAQRLSDDMERELKTLDEMFGQIKDENYITPQRGAKRQRSAGIGNVISLAQRIRALQKGMGE